MTMVRLGLGTFAEVLVNVLLNLIGQMVNPAAREAGKCALLAGSIATRSTFQVLFLKAWQDIG